jgi:hypothetical protein
MSFKSLCLNRELLESFLKSYAENISIEHEQKSKFIEYKISLPSQSMALLQVFYNNDGTTTLGCKVGKNQPLSLNIAEYLKEKVLLPVILLNRHYLLMR